MSSRVKPLLGCYRAGASPHMDVLICRRDSSYRYTLHESLIVFVHHVFDLHLSNKVRDSVIILKRESVPLSETVS